MKNTLILALMFAVLSFNLSACGKKSPLSLPESTVKHAQATAF